MITDSLFTCVIFQVITDSLFTSVIFQVIIQSGQPPTVLQQLCALPFQYFSDPRLTNVLFPTLVSCCYNNHLNREILEQDLSCALLANFIEVRQSTYIQGYLGGLAPSSLGARCSSVVRAFAHGAMGRRIDPSWGGPIKLFLVPASAPRLV